MRCLFDTNIKHSDNRNNRAQTSTTLPILNIARRRLDTFSSASVHSFEVQLLLEFCDKGCLRDALNDGAFFTSDGVLNLAAILETAAGWYQRVIDALITIAYLGVDA